MPSDKTIVFINPGQFGYKAGYYYYCKYLSKKQYRVRFLCFDQRLPKIKFDGVQIDYLEFHHNKIVRTFQWLKAVYGCIVENDHRNTVFFINYFRYCFIFGLLKSKGSKVLDIRSGSIKSNRYRNYIENLSIRLTTKVFKNITILSESLIDLLKIRNSNCHLLPLGSEIFSTNQKKYVNLNLLYVGTLSNRRIVDTIVGLSKFIKSTPIDTIKITYDIIGSGNKSDNDLITKAIIKENLGSIVTFHGRMNHDEIEPFFEKCNIGISYIPITRYYNCQPPTKTFEYVLSGMVCLATDTIENRKLINQTNGILFLDDPKSFSTALINVLENRHKFNSNLIRQSLIDYTWNNIVNHNLKQYLEQLIEKNKG